MNLVPVRGAPRAPAVALSDPSRSGRWHVTQFSWYTFLPRSAWTALYAGSRTVLRFTGWFCAGRTATAAQNTAATDASMTLRKDVLHNLTGHVGQPEIPARIPVGQLGVIHPQLVEQRGVQIV